MLTALVNIVVEHVVVALRGDVRQVQLDASVVPEPALHLPAVLQLQGGANTPHQRKDIQPLHVFTTHLPALLLKRKPALWRNLQYLLVNAIPLLP